MVIFVILTVLVAVLFWVGFEVETGRRKPQPKDAFFPLFGRNIDYVVGASGILIAIGIILDGLGLSTGSNLLAIVGIILILLGIIRAYAPPKRFGPAWIRKNKF